MSAPATTPTIVNAAIAAVLRDGHRSTWVDGAPEAAAEIEGADVDDARAIQLSSRLTSPALCQRSSGSLSRHRSTR